MGLAASQARFLALTARKSNIEYQGQQINQQRTVLANKVSNTTNEMLALNPPTPPSSTSSEYYKVSQSYSSPAGRDEKIQSWELDDSISGKYRYKITYTYMEAGEIKTGTMYTVAVDSEDELSTVLKVDNETGDIIESMKIAVNATSTDAGNEATEGNIEKYNFDQSDLTFSSTFDDKKFNDAMNIYDYEKYKYEAKLQKINAETAAIQAADKNLELRLKQLDTEHNAVQVEMDAVKAVISKNVEGTFKTFS